MVGSLVPVRHLTAAESTARREVRDNMFPIVDQWHGLEVVEEAQMLKQVILSPECTYLLLTKAMVVLLKVVWRRIQLIAIGTVSAAG
jgi:hypothetical protein